MQNFQDAGGRCSFRMEGSDALANALRRAMIADVPTAAAERVTFVENTSSFDDENVAHIVGLVPIQTAGAHPVGSTVTTMELSESGPGDVFSGSLRCPAGLARVANEDVLIARLSAGQHLQLEAHVVVGTGRQHARWSAVVAPCYRHSTGVGERECFCPGTEWGTRCDDCGHMKRLDPGAPIFREFSFETTGALSCQALLAGAVATTASAIRAVRAQC